MASSQRQQREGEIPPAEEMRPSRLVLRNYRRLRELDLELRPLNVMVGANGVGKSAVLDAFLLLAEASQGRLTSALSVRGGLDSLRTRPAEARAGVGVRIEVEVGRDSPMVYTLEVGSRGAWHEVREETFSPFHKQGTPKPYLFIDRSGADAKLHDGKRLVPVEDGSVESGETISGKAPSVPRDIARFRMFLTSVGYFGPLDVSHGAPVRGAQRLDPTLRFPGPNGDGLVSCLYNLRVHDAAVYERIEAAVRSAYPEFAGFEFPLTGLGTAMLQWREQGDATFLATELSEGTLRYVWLATALLSPAKPRVLLLDEPEVSLHPRLLMLLAGMLQEAAMTSVVVVATHADQLVRWLEPEALVLLDRDEEQGVRMCRGDDASLGLDRWLDEYRLDEVWLHGHLGGQQ